MKVTVNDLGSSPTETTPPAVKRIHHRTYQTFLQLKTPLNFIFKNQKFTSPFTFLGHYHLDHHATVGTLRNYHPQKQVFLFTPYKDLTQPLIVPQEHLILNDDYLIHAKIPSGVQEISP